MTIRSAIVGHTAIWPVRSGNAIRRSATVEALASLGPVTLVQAPFGAAAPVEDPSQLPDFPHPVVVRTVRPADRHRSLGSAVAATAQGLPSELSGYRWNAIAADVADVVGDADLVWSFRAIGWLASRQTSTPSIVDLDDLEDLKIRRTLRIGDVGLGARAGFRLRATLWSRLQRRIVTASDAALVCTESDARALGNGPIVLPNTAPEPAVDHTYIVSEPTLLLPGLHTYRPNADGCEWFVQEVWPLIIAEVPNAELRIVGKAGDRVRRLTGDRIAVTGEVDDIDPEFRSARAVVVPIRVGGGSRVKILSAWSHGTPVISTETGIEGLGTTPGDEAMIADDARSFADACIAVLGDDSLATRLGALGRARYEATHSPDRFQATVHDIVSQVMAR